MLTIETVEVAYTLAELAELDDRGRAYEKAIQEITQYVNEGGDYCQWISEDLQMWLEEKPELSDVKGIEWDYDRRRDANFICAFDVERFMKDRKLHMKYRALWYAMQHIDIWDTCVRVEAKKVHYSDHVLGEWEYMLDRYTDICDDEPKRYNKLIAQIEEVRAAIVDYIGDLTMEMQRIVTLEIDYRYSEEFAQQEADALELHFDEEGNILHI